MAARRVNHKMVKFLLGKADTNLRDSEQSTQKRKNERTRSAIKTRDESEKTHKKTKGQSAQRGRDR